MSQQDMELILARFSDALQIPFLLSLILAPVIAFAASFLGSYLK
jgi:hypothetical protein